jgi:5-methylcytosine-specific restriction protein A
MEQPYPKATLYYWNDLPTGYFSKECRDVSHGIEEVPLSGTQVVVRFIKKGGRKQYAARFGEQSQLVIVKGWGLPEFENWGSGETGDSGITLRPQRFSLTSDKWKPAFDNFLSRLLQRKEVELLADYRDVRFPKRATRIAETPAESSDEAGSTESWDPQWMQKRNDWWMRKRAERLGLSGADDSNEPSPGPLVEGAAREVSMNVYERNPEARRQCISHYGPTCAVCGFDFEEVYGDLGKGFIHVHHLVPVSDIGEEYEVDPVNDLRPVCPNCHAMLHKRQPPYTVEEMRKIMDTAR